MKYITSLLVLISLLSVQSLFSQSASWDYGFTTEASSPIDLTGEIKYPGLGFMDDEVFHVSYPFDFRVYDQLYQTTSTTHNKLTIGTNGFINVGTSIPLLGASDYKIEDIPISGTGLTGNYIAGSFISYGGFGDGKVYDSIVLKTSGAAPFRVFTVAFIGYSTYWGTNAGFIADIQISLFETTNIITVDYSNISGSANGTGAHVGINANTTGLFGTNAGNFPTTSIKHVYTPYFPEPDTLIASKSVTLPTQRIDLSFIKNSTNDNVLITYNTTNNFTPPTASTTYSVGDEISNLNDSVLYIGGASPKYHNSLNPNTIYYYQAWSSRSNGVYSPYFKYDSAKTDPVYPVNPFTASAINQERIDLAWTKNSANHDVIVTWNTTNSFSNPTAFPSTYNVGDEITPGMGTVLYKGSANSKIISNLLSSTQYFYKVWSYSSLGFYSTGVSANATTPSIADPINFTVTNSSSCENTITWAKNSLANDVIVVFNKTGAFTVPTDGSIYGLGSNIGSDTVLSITGTSYVHTPLNENIQYYYKAYSFNTNHIYSAGTSDDASTPFTPDVTLFTVTAPSAYTLNGSWTVNSQSDNVVVLWNTINTFGSLVNGSIYSNGDAIAGGGTVLTQGAISSFSQSGLDPNTTRYYKVYSYDCNTNYSDGEPASQTTDAIANPTSLSAISTSCAINVTWALSGGNDVLLLRNTTNSFITPTNGTPYNLNDPIGTATVISLGSATSKSESPLDNGITYYYKAFSYDVFKNYSLGTVVESAITSNVTNPTNLISSSTLNSITLNWSQNSVSDDVIILWNTTNTFGSLTDNLTYANGDPIVGGGTVLDQGNLTTKTHSSLSVATTYYYKVYSMDCNMNYSTGVEKSVITGSLPNPTVLTAVATSCSIDVSWSLAVGYDVLLLSNTTNVFITPTNGTPYNLNDPIGTATVISLGSLTSKTESPLDNGITKYYKAFSYDASNNYSSGTAVESATTIFNVVNPVMAASSSTLSSITLNWALNTASDEVIILWNTTNTFGNLIDATTYINGNPIAGGGTVLDQGNLTTKIHSGLTISTPYYYKVYSKDCNNNYSSGEEDSETTGSISNPTSLAAVASSCSIDLSWSLAAGNDVLLLSNTTNSFIAPTNGSPYNLNDPIGTATVISLGSGTSITESPLDNGITRYYKAYSYDASHNYSSGTAVESATTTLNVVNPVMAASSSTLSSITLNWALNTVSDEVIILWNTTNTFGNLIDATTYTNGNPIAGGGTVLDQGNLTTKTHSGLTISTPYYYKVYSKDCNNNYSSGVAESITTSASAAIANPQSFSANSAGVSSIDLAWVLNNAGDSIIILRNTTGVFIDPINGLYLEQTNTFITGYVVYKGLGSSYTDDDNGAGLDQGVTYYYKAYSVNALHVYSLGLTDDATTDVVADPLAFNATTVSGTKINLTWNANVLGDNVMIIYNTVDVFTQPIDGVPYSVGGTILYRGIGTPTNSFEHTNLNTSTKYYYKIWSYDNAFNYYSTPGLHDTTTTMAPGIAILPHITNFDNEISTTGTPSCGITHTLVSDWQNVTGDDADWAPRVGSTTSSFTGPDNDNTTGTGAYLFTEASNPCSNKTHWLVSPLYNFVGLTNPRIEFYYHMYGALMGTVSVQASTDGGATWSSSLSTSWSSNSSTSTSISVQQHVSYSADYSLADVNLSAYAGMSNIKLRITGHTGNGYTSDMAIDDIKVYQPQNMVITSVTVEQDSDPVVLGDNAQGIIRVKVLTNGAFSPLSITQLNIGTSGTTQLTDIMNARVYYTGSNPNFSAAQSFGNVVTTPGATFQINGTKSLQDGVNYLWLTYDIKSTATINNFVDASCSQVTISGVAYTPTVTSPPATKKIIGVITIEGTTSTSSDGPVFRPNYNGAYEMIYLASELGTSPKELTRIEFHKNSGSDVINKVDPIIIWMKSSNVSTLANGTVNTAGYTPVYSGLMPNNKVTGWLGVDFLNPFLYDGTNNIHILVTQIEMTTTWWDYAIYSHHSTAPAMRKRGNYDWNVPVTNMIASSARANVKLQYETPQPMSYVSSTTTHPNLSNIGVGANGEEIIRVEVVTQNTATALALTKMNINITGSTAAADISTAKIYYTGSSSNFAAVNQFGVNTSNPSGSYAVNGSQTLVSGTNYFWVVYDISSSATVNNVVDAVCESLVISGASKTPTVTAPVGNRKIKEYITIGTGTVTANDHPLTDYAHHKWEGIYLSSELGAAKDISALAFFKASGNNTTNDILSVTIYMKHTTDNSLVTGNATNAGYTQVFTGNFPNSDTSGWMEVSFTSPFAYNGTDNVSFYIEQNRTNWFNNPPFWAYTTTTANRARYAESFSALPTNLPATNKLANVRLEYNPPINMSYVSSTMTQNNTSTITSGVFDQEIVGVKIEMLNSANPLNSTAFTFNTSGSSNPTSDITKARVYYTSSNSTFTTTNQFGVDEISPDGSFTITGSQALTLGTNYFWLVYDVPASATNGNWVDAQCTNVKIGTTNYTPSITDIIGNRTIQSALSGYYTIGSTGDYPNFTTAISALNTLGVSGWVTFQVQSGTYTEKITLNAVNNASATNVITFEALSGDSSDVTLQFASSVWGDAATLLFGTGEHFVVRNMTIKATGLSYGHAVEFSSTNNGTNVVRNCVLSVTSTSTSTAAAVVYANGLVNNNSRIANNKITATGYGIYINGNFSANASGLELDSNDIATNSYGLYALRIADMKIRGNTIIANTGSSNYRGIYISNSDGPLQISENNIVAKGTNYSYGIYVSGSDGISTNRIDIYNNFVSNITNANTSIGITLQNSDYINVLFNNINGTSTSGSNRSGVSVTTGSNIAIKNNNIIASGGGFALNISSTSNLSSDYNNIYSTGTYVGSYNSSQKTTLAAWQVSTSGDANSISSDPVYNSSIDLHVNNASLNNAATAITGITTDIDGDARHATTPDIGADEMSSDLDAGIIAITDPTSPICTAGINAVKATIKNFGSTALTSATINWKVNGANQSAVSWTGNLAQGATQNVTLGNFNFLLNSNDIEAWTSIPNGAIDQYTANDSSSAIITVSSVPTVTVGNDTAICATSFTTSNSVVSTNATLLWSSTGTGTFNSGSSLIDTYNPSPADYAAGSVYLKLLATNICGSDEDSLLLTLSQPISVSFTGNAPQYCANAPVDTFYGTPTGGAFSGPGMSGNIFNPANANTGINTITYVYTSGVCSASSIQTIQVDPIPTVTMTGLASTYCNNDATVTLIGTPAGGAFGGNGVTGNIFDPSSTTIASPSKVWYSYSNASCNSSDTQFVSINQTPIADAGSDIIMGTGSTLLSGSQTGGSNVSFAWTPIAKLLQSDIPNPSTIVLTSNENFILTTTDTINGCSSTDDVDVIITGGPTTVVVNASPDTICDGDTSFITTTAGGGNGIYTYLWTSVPAGFTSTNPNINVTPSADTTYHVAVTSNGSTANASVSIIVNPIPNPSFTGLPATMCSNDNPVTLIGSPTGGIFSGSGIVGDVFNPTLIGAGSYDIVYTATNTNGCSNSSTSNVVVNSVPIANAGNDAGITIGTSTVLNGSATGGTGSYSYSWADAAFIAFGATTATPTTTNLNNATIFTLTVTDNGNTCSDNDDVLISVGTSSLAASISATEDTICNSENSQLQVTAAGGSLTYTYSWTSNPIGFTSSIENPVVNPTTTTTYSVVVNDGISTVNKSKVIIVNSLPNANAGTDYTIASGTSTTLSGSASGGSGTYSYSWTPIAFIASGVNTATPNTTILSNNRDFTLSVVDGNNCSNTDDITIAVSSTTLAVAVTADPAAVCLGNSSTVTAVPNGGTGSYSYSWSSTPSGYTNSGTDTIIVSPLVTTTYTVTVTSGALSASSSDTVVVHPLIIVNAGTDQNIGSATSTTLSGSASGGSGVTQFSWTPTTLIAAGANSVNATTTILTSDVTYTLTVFDMVTGCTATDDVIVNVGNSLAVTATASPNTICAGETSQLLAVATGGSSTYNYAWTSNPTGFVSNIANPIVNPSVSTTYSIIVFDGINIISNSVSVTVNQTPDAIAGLDVFPAINAGTSTTLNGSISAVGDNIKYSWTPVALISGNSHIINPTTTILNTTTQYILEAQDSINGCSDQDTMIVNVVNPNSVIVVASASPDTVCLGSSTQLTALATGTPTYNYAWSSVPSGFVSTIANPIATPTITTIYQVIVIDAASNTDTAWQTVIVSPIPNASLLGLSSDYCDDASSVNLLGSPAGGVYSGPGVSGSLFDPANANVGVNEIIYTVNQNGCSDADTQYVSINETPIANAGTDITMGSGTTVLNGSHTGGQNVGYFWTPSIMLIQSNIPNPSTVVLTATQKYILTTMDTIFGCSSSDSVDVIIIGGPTTVTVNASPSTICNGDTSFITTTVGGGDGNYTYSWTSVPAGFTSSNADIVVTPSSDIIYNVVVTSDGSSASGSASITVNPIPNITFSGLTTPSCANASAMTLSGSPIGGTFTGTGVSQVSGNYVFDPSVATAGNWDVIYNYTNSTTGCSNADTQYVSVNANPIVNAGSDAVVYIGNTASLSGSATSASNYLYEWTPTLMVVNSNSATTQTIALMASQIFTLTVTDSITSCAGVDEVQINVSNPVVPVSITANVTPSTICSGDTAFVTSIATDGSGVYTYSWTSVPVGFTSTDQNPKALPNVTTVYTVVVDDGATIASASITVNVKTTPIVGLFGLDTTNCSNGLKDTIQGYPMGGFYSGAGMSANVFDPISAGNGYHIIQYTYTASNGCTGFDTDTTHVYAAPNANAGSNQLIIVPPSQTASLSGSATGGSGSYNYSWSPANLFTNANQQNVTTAGYLLYSTPFTLEVEDQVSLCKSTDLVEITIGGGVLTVNPVATPDTICAGDPVQLTAYAGGGATPYMYAWTSNPSGYIDITSNPIVTPTVTTTYTINVFDGTNTVSSNVVVEVGEIPNVNITTSMSLYCENGIDESILAIPAGGIFYGNGMSGNTFSPTNAGNGSHQIIYEYQSPYGCISSDTVYAMVQTSPISDAGSDISIPCNGAGGLIGSNAVANKTYSWTPSFGLSQPTYSNTIANPTTNTLYTLMVTDTITTCTNTDDVMVTVIGGPILSVSNDTIICKGAAVTLMASGSATSYLWSNGQSNGNITVAPVASIVYSVTAFDASTCTTVDSVIVIVNAPNVFLGPDIVVNDTNTIVLDAGYGYVDYLWNTGSTGQAIEVEAYINAQLGLNKYVVQVTDIYGCQAKDSVMITYMLDINELSVNSKFNVYPNPSKGKFTIEIENDQPMDYVLEIVNLQGKIIHNHKINAFGGVYSQKLDLSNLAKGVYLIRLFNNDYLSTKKLIIN